MSDYGPQDTSTTSLGVNQFPISEAWTPNVGFAAVEGGPQTTDSGGKKSTPVSLYAKDGGNVTFGAQADAAATTDAGTFTFMALFKRLLGKLLVGQQTMANSVGVAIASNQSAVPASVATTALYTLASIATTGDRKSTRLNSSHTVISY